MATAGSIRAGRAFIELTADDSKLQATLRATQARLRAVGATVGKVGRSLLTAGTAITAPLVGLTKLFASQGDQLNKMAVRTGVSTEALSQLGFAAEQSGSNIETLEAGFRGMARFIDGAERGLSTSNDALGALSLTVDELKGLKPEQQFELLADRIARVDDPTKRAALAMAIFGKSGQQLVPLLSAGTQGISELRAEADRLGLTIGGETAQSAADLTDQINRVYRQVKQLGFTIGASLAPRLIEAGQAMQRALPGAIRWVQEHENAIVAAAKFGVQLVAYGVALLALSKIITTTTVVFGGLQTAIRATHVALTFLSAHPVVALISLLAAGVVGLVATLRSASRETHELAGSMADLAAAGDRQRAQDQQRVQRLQQLSQAQRLTNQQMAESRSIIETLESRYGDLGLSVDSVSGRVLGLVDAQKKLNDAMRQAAVAQVDAEILERQRNLQKLKQEYDETPGVVDAGVFTFTEAQRQEQFRERQQQLRDLRKSIEIEQAKLDALFLRKRALDRGDDNAITGEAGQPSTLGPGGLGDYEDPAEVSRLKTIAKAESDLARLDEEWARRHRTATENRIADIQREADERRAAIDILIGAETDLRRSHELSVRRAQIDRQEQEDIAAVRADAAKKEADKSQERIQQRDDAEKQLVDQLAQTRIDAMKDGLQKELAQIAFNRGQALREARAQGVAPDLVNRLYDLKRQLALQASAAETSLSRSAAGTFNARAIQSLQTTPDDRRLLTASEKTATNTDRIRRNQERNKQKFL